MKSASLFLLIIAAMAQDGAAISGVCHADATLTAATSADPGSSSSSLTIAPPPIRCEKGPMRKIHTVRNEFHWPPIYKGSCDKLKCDIPPCIVLKKVWRRRCVLVYRLVHGCWKRIGYRTVRYLNHLSCTCRKQPTCRDITNRKQCSATKPCPKIKNTRSFCYWIPKHSRCDCCIPKFCRYPKVFNKNTCSCICPKQHCPPGQKLNPNTCKCECPPGSKKVQGKCIGTCKSISLRYCKYIVCRENRNHNCFIRSHSCVCPSCKGTSASKCPKTRCLEQKNKPYCIYDTYAKKCRCPECKDQKTSQSCRKIYCGPNFSKRCRYDYRRRKCSCPNH